MHHSDLPAWLQPALPATRHGYRVEYDEDAMRELLKKRLAISAMDGLTITVHARIGGRCWSCGGKYQEGVLWQTSTGFEVFTVRHVRRRGCGYRVFSYADEGDGSWNPGVQVDARLMVTLRLVAE